MDDTSSWEPIYREPGIVARLFVQVFAMSSPLLTLVALIVPAGLFVKAGTFVAAVSGVAYALALVAGVRAVRRLASRFTPPLTLPGDIWNIGVPEPPRRSRNWPIRFRRLATSSRG
jgi:hypothetical protein